MKELRLEDIAVGVFTSALNLRERALSVQNTWLSDFPKGFLIGGWKEDPELRMISLGPDVGEDYRSAHRKQFLGLLELHRRFPEAAWYYLTGCDAYVYAENLRVLLSGFDPDEDFLVGGHCGQAMVDGKPLVFPAGGPGFALSRSLVAALAGLIPAFVAEWEGRADGLATACDIALAYLVRRERGVAVSFAEGFYSCPPYRYPGNPYKNGEGADLDRPVIEKPIAFHALSIREMYLLYRGRRLRKPGLPARAFDIASSLVSRRLRSKRVVNRIVRVFLSRGVR